MHLPHALQTLRIGCVQYLNSKPLIHGLPDVCLRHSSELAHELRSGNLDVALVPVFEFLRNPEAYVAIDGLAIASRGPVYSVFVAHQEPLTTIPSLWADPASLTSVHLMQILFSKVVGRKAPLTPAPVTLTDPTWEDLQQPGHARLLIGNQAIAFRLHHSANPSDATPWKYWDLGEVWQQWTSLPFVYAVWVMRADLPQQEAVASAFRQIANEGLGSLERILAEEKEVPADIARRYLTHHIVFDLGTEEKAGLERYYSELQAAGFVSDRKKVLRFAT